MLSDVIKSALEKEVAGQQRAVNSIVRGATRAVSGLMPSETPRCAYVLMGPTGTGKTHVVRTLTKVLQGDSTRLVICDCSHFAQGDPWSALVKQIAPLFMVPRIGGHWTVLDTPPLSILLIDYLERGRPELSKALAAALETGHLTLPDGRQGSLRNTLIFITSSLCASEIFDEDSGIGFAGAVEGRGTDNGEKLFRTCHAEAEEHFGADLMARLDGLLLFHPLREEHLAGILDRMFEGLNREIALRGFACRLAEPAKAFLLEKGLENLRFGARHLVRAHRRFVEFPVGDLMVSRRIPSGGLVLIDHKPGDENLHFAIRPGGSEHLVTPPESMPQSVTVDWDEDKPGSGAVH
jgi:ATP-dependent Clp protease ATP-binding subunit ClpC